MKKSSESRVWQAIVPGTQNKPQDTLQIRKTPWHGVTKQPPAVPLLAGPNVTPEPNEKIKGLAGNCSRPSNQETPWHGVTKQPPAVPLPGPNVTPELNEKIKGPNVTPELTEIRLFQAQKPSHKTPFEAGKHPGTA